jgi:hypothetical protein
VCGAVTRDDVAAVVIQALLSDKADNKVGGVRGRGRPGGGLFGQQVGGSSGHPGAAER